MKRSDAPWSAEQVASLNSYQQNPGTHPFTGERDAGGDETVLVATKDGWREREDGPIVQTWAHQFMTDWSWKRLADAQVAQSRNEAIGFIYYVHKSDLFSVGAASVFVGYALEYHGGNAVLLTVDQGGAKDLEVALAPEAARRVAQLLIEMAGEMERTAAK